MVQIASLDAKIQNISGGICDGTFANEVYTRWIKVFGVRWDSDPKSEANALFNIVWIIK